jgi:hypothetical protein
MIVFDAANYEEFNTWALAGIRKGAIDGMLSVAMRTVNVITTQIIPNEKPPPVDRAIFRAGFRVEKFDTGATVVNSVPWAVIVDQGVRGENVKIGRKMIDALAEWVLRKNIVWSPSTNKLTIAAKPKNEAQKRTRESDARHLAWAIAMSMKKNGIFNREFRGLQISAKAAREALKFAPKEIKAQIARELAKGKR